MSLRQDADDRFDGAAPEPGAGVDRQDIPACVERLSRPAPGGRRVIERAAIMAEGATAAAILDWLAAAAWVPEDPLPDARKGGSGLHGMRGEAQRRRDVSQPPRRYVSPPPAAVV